MTALLTCGCTDETHTPTPEGSAWADLIRRDLGHPDPIPAIRCPWCKAPPGEACTAGNKRMRNVHPARLGAQNGRT